MHTTAGTVASTIAIVTLCHTALGQTATSTVAEQTRVPVEEGPPSPPGASTTWYGYETLVSDGVSLGLLALAGATSDTGTPAVGQEHSGSPAVYEGVFGLSGYRLGTPIIHAFNGKPWMGAVSLGMRFGMAVTGFGLGMAVAPHCEQSSELAPSCDWTLWYGAAGAMLAAGGAAAIDATLLAHRPAAPHRGTRPISLVIQVAPWVSASHRGLSLSGIF